MWEVPTLNARNGNIVIEAVNTSKSDVHWCRCYLVLEKQEQRTFLGAEADYYIVHRLWNWLTSVAPRDWILSLFEAHTRVYGIQEEEDGCTLHFQDRGGRPSGTLHLSAEHQRDWVEQLAQRKNGLRPYENAI